MALSIRESTFGVNDSFPNCQKVRNGKKMSTRVGIPKLNSLKGHQERLRSA